MRSSPRGSALLGEGCLLDVLFHSVDKAIDVEGAGRPIKKFSGAGGGPTSEGPSLSRRYYYEVQEIGVKVLADSRRLPFLVTAFYQGKGPV